MSTEYIHAPEGSVAFYNYIDLDWPIVDDLHDFTSYLKERYRQIRMKEFSFYKPNMVIAENDLVEFGANVVGNILAIWLKPKKENDALAKRFINQTFPLLKKEIGRLDYNGYDFVKTRR